MKKSISAPWLVRFYNWYHEDRRRRRQEDLCHFGRVVFFWAPLYWFFERRIFGWVRPWLIVSSAALLTFYAVLFAAAPQAMGIVTLYILAIGVGAGAIFAVAVPLLQSLDHGRLNRFLFWPEDHLVQVWMFLAVGAFALLSYFAAYYIVTIVVYLLGMVAAIGGATGFLVLASHILILIGRILISAIKRVFAFLARILPPLPSVEIRFSAPVSNALENVAGVFSLGWNWLLTLKRRTICPWVTFKDGVIEFEFAPEPAELQRATKMVVFLGAKAQEVTSAKPKPKPKRKKRAGPKRRRRSKR